METVHGRTRLVMSFKINVETSKCLARVFLCRNSMRWENELQEFAKLVEA